MASRDGRKRKIAASEYHRRRRQSTLLRTLSAPLLSTAINKSSSRLYQRSLAIKEHPENWFDYVDSTNDFEEAWLAFGDDIWHQLMEQSFLPVPYLCDAIFYNLNAAVLKQGWAMPHDCCIYQPAGPLHRLCSKIMDKTFNRISTSKPTAESPWIRTNYFSQKDDGVRKEIELIIDDVFRCSNEFVPDGEVQINMETLAAIGAIDDNDVVADGSTLEDTVFENGKPPFNASTPDAAAADSACAWFRGKLDSIYVIHELIYAKSVVINIRIGENRSSNRVENLLRSKKAFPVGFKLTEYKIDDQGWLHRDKGFFDPVNKNIAMNISENVPWPPMPPNPKIISSTQRNEPPNSTESKEDRQKSRNRRSTNRKIVSSSRASSSNTSCAMSAEIDIQVKNGNSTKGATKR